MELAEVLAFVRTADEHTWSVLIREMGVTRKARDHEAAKRFHIGELVSFELPDSGERLEGPIVKIARGRITLALASEQEGLLQHVGVPASMLQKCG